MAQRDRDEQRRRDLRESRIDLGVSVNNRNYSQEDPGYEGYIGADERNPLARWGWAGGDRGRQAPGGAWRGGPGRGFHSPGFEVRDVEGGSFGSDFGRPRRQGRFAGRGPSGYRRSDERIREDINEQLTEHPDIDPTNVSVTVDGGTVVLAGQVENRRTKYLIEDVAASVRGVTQLRNDLRVVRNG